MNEKIYNTEKLLSGAQERKYKLFVQDDYGTWQNALSGASGCASIQESVMWSRYYYTGGVKYNASANSTRTIPRLKSAKSIKFEMLIYTISSGASLNSWDSYIKLCNSFFNISSSKSSFGIYVNNVLLANLTLGVRYNIEIKQNCFYLNGARHGFPDDLLLVNATGNEIACRSWMSSASGTYTYEAKLYLELKNLSVTW